MTTTANALPIVAVTGRSPFPKAVLDYCVLLDQTDYNTVARSHHLGAAFHGVVELQYPPFHSSRLSRDLDAAGWRILPEPVHEPAGWAAARLNPKRAAS